MILQIKIYMQEKFQFILNKKNKLVYYNQIFNEKRILGL